MSNNRNWLKSIAAISELEQRDAPATLEARVSVLVQVCRDAAALEKLSQCERHERWPWPESTRDFLREKAKAIYGE